MTNPLVSIIMPVYNSEKVLKAAIDSVLQQTYANWELIIVDDKSTDQSLAIIQTYTAQKTNIILIEQAENSGAAISRNKGIAKAKGKYIAFLDADDIWLPEKLALQIAFMEKNQSALTCTYYSTMQQDGTPFKSIIKAPDRITYHQLLKNNTIGCLTAVYNVEICGKQYMPEIRKRQDYGLWLNILRAGYIAETIPLVLAQYRFGADSLSQNKWKVLGYNWELLRKHQQLSVFKSLYYFTCFLWNKTFKYLK